MYYVDIVNMYETLYTQPFVSFIDDYSRNTWIYFLKNKSEVFDKFKEFKALIENHSERRIKTLRSDNGGEYTSKEFEAFSK